MKKSRKFIKITRDSNQNRQDVGIKSNGAGVYQDVGQELSSGVKENITEQITVFDENNNERIIEFARLNERIKKDGTNNPHKVIDKLARKTDNNSRLAVAHSAEIVEVSDF